MIDRCIAELQYKTKIFGDRGAVSIYRGEVIKSDTTVSSSPKDELRRSVSSLKEVREYPPNV
jgi:hypothetical protein